jgi:glucan phosphoethanolaminetransferase (alkaline phosphatase superfamily)
MSLAQIIDIHGLAIGLVLFGLVFWVAFARALAGMGAARWPAAVLGLPLILAGIAVSAFWQFFFSSPGNAVIAFATRSTIRHEASGYLTAAGVIWLFLALFLILRAMKRARQ